MKRKIMAALVAACLFVGTAIPAFAVQTPKAKNGITFHQTGNGEVSVNGQAYTDSQTYTTEADTVTFKVAPAKDNKLTYLYYTVGQDTTYFVGTDAAPGEVTNAAEYTIKKVGAKTDVYSTFEAIGKPVPVYVESIELDRTSVPLNVGDSILLNATVKPDNADNKALTWTSDKPEIADVDQTGKVTAKANGDAVITVTAKDGSNVNQVCNVHVAETTYTITATAGPNGKTSPAGEIKVEEGKSEAIKLIPDAGFMVDTLTVDGETAVAPNNTYVFEKVTADHTIHVTFKKVPADKYSVVSDVKNGEIYYEDANGKLVDVTGGVAKNTRLTAVVVPNPYYVVDTIALNGVAPVPTIKDGKTTFDFVVTGNVVVKATFAEVKTEEISAQIPADTATSVSIEGTTIIIQGTAPIPAGTTVQILPPAVPEKGNAAVAQVNAAKKPAGVASITPVLVFDLELSVTSGTLNGTFKFEIPAPTSFVPEKGADYQIGHVSSNKGVIWKALEITADGKMIFNVNANEGFSPFVVAKVSKSSGGNGGYHGSWGGSTATSFSGYTITAEAGANGSISPEGETKVSYGESQTYTVTPNAGYVVDKVIVDGKNEVALTNGQYTFKDVTEPYTIKATFKRASSGTTAPDAGTSTGTNPAPIAPNPSTGDSWFSNLFGF